MSKSVDLARLIATFLNETSWDWPSVIVPTTPDRLDTVVTAKAFVVPITSRVTLSTLQVSIAPQPIVSKNFEFSDQCGSKWEYRLDIAISKKLATNDADFEQPATLQEIDDLMTFTESMRDFLDYPSHRYEQGASLRQIEYASYDKTLLEQEQIYLATIQPTYFF